MMMMHRIERGGERSLCASTSSAGTWMFGAGFDLDEDEDEVNDDDDDNNVVEGVLQQNECLDNNESGVVTTATSAKSHDDDDNNASSLTMEWDGNDNNNDYEAAGCQGRAKDQDEADEDGAKASVESPDDHHHHDAASLTGEDDEDTPRLSSDGDGVGSYDDAISVIVELKLQLAKAMSEREEFSMKLHRAASENAVLSDRLTEKDNGGKSTGDEDVIVLVQERQRYETDTKELRSENQILRQSMETLRQRLEQKTNTCSARDKNKKGGAAQRTYQPETSQGDLPAVTNWPWQKASTRR